jgi:hypothetical protein
VGDVVTLVLTMESTFAELMSDPIGGAIVREALGQMVAVGGAGGDAESDEGASAVGDDIVKVMGSFPWGRMVSSGGGAATTEQLQQLLDAVNAGRQK